MTQQQVGEDRYFQDERPSGDRGPVQPALETYKGWLIDMDGTLYHAPLVKLVMGLQLVAGHWKAVSTLRVFRQEHEAIRRQQPAVKNGQPYRLQIERAAVLLNCSADEVERLVNEWMIRRPGRWLRLFRRRRLLAQIARFRRIGGRTALVSDYPARHKLAALGATDLFDAVVAVGEEGGPGSLKPSPEGYLLAAEKLGLPPEQCLVLGDRIDADGEAARSAGMSFQKITLFGT